MSKIENHSIFGCYSQPENGVTLAFLQILKAGGTKFISEVIDEIDGIDFPSSEINIVTQKKENKNVYDGKLECDFSFRVLVESKIKSESINKAQLEGLKNNAKRDTDYILYITCDNEKPKELDCDNPKIYWANWKRINEIFQNRDSDTELVNFLINEFEKYLNFLGLLNTELSEQRVQIAAGSFGEPIALKYGFYACQNNRSRKDSKYLAFYHRWKINTLFEIIGEPQNDCDITTIDDENVKKYFDDGKEARDSVSGSFRQFYKLKLISDRLDIEHPKGGRGSAYTMGAFRYTTIDKIKEAKTTDDL